MGCNCGNKTKTVVSTVPTTTTELCSCGKPKSDCGKGTCGCNHEQKPCLEDHSVTLVESVYTTTVTATDTWVMPAVDDCVQLHLKDVTNILPGSILWNKSVGYLHVSSYDASSGYVTACNEGEDGNAEVGSTFPSCMSFHVGIPTQCNCDDGYTGACLAADVTSPGVGETTEVSVTTVSGLFIGDIIDIAGYMYKITAITDINTITVKNEGFGAPIGTVIKNDPNCTGKPCTVKITVVNSDDPCTKNPVNEGVIIVCDEGERKPFEGTADSQIAVWDNEVKKWKLRTVKLENECTNLTADLTLDPLVTLYLITVEDTSIFEVGKTVYLDNRKFKVNSIVNATQMRIQIEQAPSAIKVVEEGAAICKGDCCEDLVIPEMPDLPAKYSNVVTVPGSINNLFYNNTKEPLKLPDESTDTFRILPSNDDNFTNTITISAPVSGKNITLLGVITIQYKGVAAGDSHFQTHDTSKNAFVYHVPPRVCLSGNATITNGGTTTKLYPTRTVSFRSNGAQTASDGTRGKTYDEGRSIEGLYTYDAFYSTPVNSDGMYEYPGTNDATSGSVCPITQTITLPVSITLNGSNSITITIVGKVLLLNARSKLTEKSGQNKTNETVSINITERTIATSLAWIIQ